MWRKKLARKKIWLFLLACALAAYPRPDSLGADYFENDLGMSFVPIPAGTFTMGAREGDDDVMDSQRPAHKVTLTRSFYMGEFEVTQGDWRRVMGSARSDSSPQGDDYPVNNVTRAEIDAFFVKLNALDSANRYRLPTEAEWEYSARADTLGPVFFGEESRVADYGNCATKQIQEVGLLRPNPWGLYDVYGNVYESVHDWYDDDYYSISPEVDPQGPPGDGGNFAPLKAARGAGAFSYSETVCTSVFREMFNSTEGDQNLGFRALMEYPFKGRATPPPWPRPAADDPPPRETKRLRLNRGR
ncbi:MAG: formylglycine-generating enzyme family protein [Deltaproteobacteria bacterium]|jgi:formylglycine-generating enzyme required for sulfatase activity|nr:formylglycine-generating enzyme family protein [Deltaproteobacteria bacterium]